MTVLLVLMYHYEDLSILYRYEDLLILYHYGDLWVLDHILQFIDFILEWLNYVY